MTAQPALTTDSGTPAAGARHWPVLCEFAVEDDLRYLSHRDEWRMFSRALVRARWPLAYSEGFNPRPRLTLALPRTVGMTSTCELALVALRTAQDPQTLYNALSATLPAGCGLKRLIAPAPPGTPHPLAATYELTLDPADVATLQTRTPQLLARDTLVIQREHGPKKPTRPLDVRPFIKTLEIDAAVPALRMTLQFVDQRTARPAELIRELELPATKYIHRLRRVQIQWDMDLSGSNTEPQQ